MSLSNRLDLFISIRANFKCTSICVTVPIVWTSSVWTSASVFVRVKIVRVCVCECVFVNLYMSKLEASVCVWVHMSVSDVHHGSVHTLAA